LRGVAVPSGVRRVAIDAKTALRELRDLFGQLDRRRAGLTGAELTFGARQHNGHHPIVLFGLGEGLEETGGGGRWVNTVALEDDRHGLCLQGDGGARHVPPHRRHQAPRHVVDDPPPVASPIPSRALLSRE
jgi:hypothetical protein